jgi:nucleoside-diphosphate-sugar epimerase
MGKHIIVTGGSGKAGRHVIQFLVDQGHDILNLDLVPLPSPLNNMVHTLNIDLTDGGQVWSAMSSFQIDGAFPGSRTSPRSRHPFLRVLRGTCSFLIMKHFE